MMDRNNKESADKLIDAIGDEPNVSPSVKLACMTAISISKSFCHELADIARAIRGIPDPIPNEEDY